MPTPLAHGVAGSALARTFQSDWRSWRFVALAVVVASLPDLDFIPGVLVGDAGGFHRRATHSIFAAIVLSLPIAALLWRFGPRLLGRTVFPGGKRPDLRTWYAFVAPIYGSHLLLDLVSLDAVGNSGLQLAWPFSTAYVTAPIPLPAGLRSFFDLQFGPAAPDFFATLFSGHAFAVYLAEAVIFTPLLLIPVGVGWIRSRRLARVEDADQALVPPASTIDPATTPTRVPPGSAPRRRPEASARSVA